MHVAGKVVVAGLALVVLGGTAFGYTKLQALDQVTRDDVIEGDAATKPGEQPADGSLDILLVGRDSRTDQQGKPLAPEVLRELRVGANGDDLTDTLIVLRIPNGTQTVRAFSIPRDSYVTLPGGKQKINAAFGIAKAAEARRLRNAGETDKAKIDQAALTAARRGTLKAVEGLTGVKIDHFAEVNLLSFYEISKAVGGVDVCLNAATKDENLGANFQAGPQRIAGADALAFVRQRDNLRGGDFDRARRQQVFLAGLAKQVLSAGTLANPGKLTDLIDAVTRSVVLDGSWNLLDFVGQMRGISGGGIEFTTIPVVNRDYRYDPKNPRATAVEVDPAAVKAFAAGLIGPPATPSSPASTAPPARPTVDILTRAPRAGSRRGSRAWCATRGSARTGRTTPRPGARRWCASRQTSPAAPRSWRSSSVAWTPRSRRRSRRGISRWSSARSTRARERRAAVGRPAVTPRSRRRASPASTHPWHAERVRRLARVLFWLAVGAVLVLTLRRVGLVSDDRVNLVPLAGIVDEWHNANVRLGLINNLGNIGVFVPIGLLGVPATGRRPGR